MATKKPTDDKKTASKKETPEKVAAKKVPAKKEAPKKAAKKAASKEPEIKAETTEIKHQAIASGKKVALNIKKGKKVLTKIGTKEAIQPIIDKIEKYNKLKDKSTVAAMKVRIGIEKEMEEVVEAKEEIAIKAKVETKTVKKVIKNQIKNAQKAAGKENPIEKEKINVDDNSTKELKETFKEEESKPKIKEEQVRTGYGRERYR